MKTLTLILTLTLSLTVNANPFEDMAFPEREHYDHDLTWAMAHAYHNEVGFEGLCERRARFAQDKLMQAGINDSYLVGMDMRRSKTQGTLDYKKTGHMVLCKDGECVDTTGVIANQFTVFPEEELKYHAWEIERVDQDTNLTIALQGIFMNRDWVDLREVLE